MDGAGEVGEANSVRVRATPLLIAMGEGGAVVAAALGAKKRVGGVEAVAQQGDPTKTTTTSTKSQTGGMVVHPFDPSSSSLRTFPPCTHNAKRPDTRSMRRDVAAPR